MLWQRIQEIGYTFPAPMLNTLAILFSKICSLILFWIAYKICNSPSMSIVVFSVLFGSCEIFDKNGSRRNCHAGNIHKTTTIWDIDHPGVEVFLGIILIHLQFQSFPDLDVARVVGILMNKGLPNPTQQIPWLALSWRYNEPCQHQPCQWLVTLKYSGLSKRGVNMSNNHLRRTSFKFMKPNYSFQLSITAVIWISTTLPTIRVSKLKLDFIYWLSFPVDENSNC